MARDRRRHGARSPRPLPTPRTSASRAPRAASRSARIRAATKPELSKLAQDPQVPLPQRTDVGDVVTELRGALEPTAEREPAPLLRVEADVREHLRVDHAGAAHLDPPGELARAATRAAADPARDVRLDRG